MRPVLVSILVALAAPAAAQSEKTEPFAATEVFAPTVRFLRIDAGVKIVEKDADAGYVLFDLTEDKHTFRGALELVKTQVEGRESVRLVLRIADRPSYVEELLLEKLDAKLRGELRPTKIPPKADKPAAPKEPGAESGSGAASSS
jgi:hypothetical protein